MLSSVAQSCKGRYGVHGSGRRSGQGRRTNKGTPCEQTRAFLESGTDRLTFADALCVSASPPVACARKFERTSETAANNLSENEIRDPCTHTMKPQFWHDHA